MAGDGVSDRVVDDTDGRRISRPDFDRPCNTQEPSHYSHLDRLLGPISVVWKNLYGSKGKETTNEIVSNLAELVDRFSQPAEYLPPASKNIGFEIAQQAYRLTSAIIRFKYPLLPYIFLTGYGVLVGIEVIHWSNAISYARQLDDSHALERHKPLSSEDASPVTDDWMHWCFHEIYQTHATLPCEYLDSEIDWHGYHLHQNMTPMFCRRPGEHVDKCDALQHLAFGLSPEISPTEYFLWHWTPVISRILQGDQETVESIDNLWNDRFEEKHDLHDLIVSHMPGKDELHSDFDNLIYLAQTAQCELRRFNSHVDRMIGYHLISARWTSRIVDDFIALTAGEEADRASLSSSSLPRAGVNNFRSGSEFPPDQLVLQACEPYLESQDLPRGYHASKAAPSYQGGAAIMYRGYSPLINGPLEYANRWFKAQAVANYHHDISLQCRPREPPRSSMFALWSFALHHLRAIVLAITSSFMIRIIHDNPSSRKRGRNSSSGRSFEVLRMTRKFYKRPLRRGFKRVRWDCKCGKKMFTDVQELRQGAAQRLQNEISHYTSNSSVSSSSSQTSLTTVSSFSTATSITTATHSLDDTPNSGSIITKEPFVLRPALAVPDRKLLLLCIKQSRYKTAVHQVEITGVVNDRNLFDCIRRHYYQSSRWRTGRLPLFHPVSVKALRFELIPLRRSSLISELSPPSIPPAEEVLKTHRYHYYHCPLEIEPPIPIEPFLHAFYDSDEHTLDFWLNRLPKKLKSELSCTQSSAAVGWGILIIDGLNWYALSCILFLLLFGNLALFAIWIAVPGPTHGDVQGGAVVGSLLASLEGAVVTWLICRHPMQRAGGIGD